jgi:MarR family transcriptional regulator, organic hydroperoxide resistance regulator
MPKSHSIDQFSRQVVEIMPLLVREFAKREDNELTRGAISCPQMVTLDYAMHRKRVKITDIARILDIRASSASTLVDRLIRQKMIARQRDAKDRRVVWITATAKGRKVVRQILAQKRQSVKAIFGRLTADEREKYLSVLLKVRDHLVSEASC